MFRRFAWFLFQSPEQGALSTLFAATSPQALGGFYYGPDRLSELRGYPAIASIPPEARDLPTAARLWNESERLTGVTFSSSGAQGASVFSIPKQNAR